MVDDFPALINLKKFRLDKGWTQEQLAEKSGITQETISAYETGKQKPLPKNTIKLARTLDCTLNDLFGIDRGIM